MDLAINSAPKTIKKIARASMLMPPPTPKTWQIGVSVCFVFAKLVAPKYRLILINNL